MVDEWKREGEMTHFTNSLNGSSIPHLSATREMAVLSPPGMMRASQESSSALLRISWNVQLYVFSSFCFALVWLVWLVRLDDSFGVEERVWLVRLDGVEEEVEVEEVVWCEEESDFEASRRSWMCSLNAPWRARTPIVILSDPMIGFLGLEDRCESCD